VKYSVHADWAAAAHVAPNPMIHVETARMLDVEAAQVRFFYRLCSRNLPILEATRPSTFR
jgi:hypothetical protein